MNQTCRVCGEPAAGFHFGAFTCEGCKSFFGRSYNNLNANECKNNNKCIIDKKNRTTCKSCRLRKCLLVGMSKGSSRYGRRSNWFKIHCLLQEHQQQAMEAAGKAVNGVNGGVVGGISASSLPPNMQQPDFKLHHQHMQQHHQQQQQRNSAAAAQLAAAHDFLGAYPGYAAHHHAHQLPHQLDSATASPFMSAAALAAAAAAARHPAAAEAAAFFSMMNSSQSAFQLPPHLLLSAAAAGYHPNAAAAAAADAAYRAEMYLHRQSMDSAASGDSHRFASTAAEQRLQSPAATSPSSTRHSPELCVSGDDEETKHETTKSPKTTKPTLSIKIHSPIPIRAKPLDLNQISHSPLNHNNCNSNSSITDSHKPYRTATAALSPVGMMASIVPTPTPTPTSGSQPRTPEPILATPATLQYTQRHTLTAASLQHPQQQQPPFSQSMSPQPNAEQTALAFAAKMQSLSPVSVCSIGAETAVQSAALSLASNDQDCPIDLSMKQTTTTQHDDEPPQKSLRRKFYQLNSENENTSSSLSSPTSSSLSVATSSAYSHHQRDHDESANNNNNNNINVSKAEMSAPNSPTTLITLNDHVKRQKLSNAVEAVAAGAATAVAATTVPASYNNFSASNHGTTNLHGFFVCV